MRRVLESAECASYARASHVYCLCCPFYMILCSSRLLAYSLMLFAVKEPFIAVRDVISPFALFAAYSDILFSYLFDFMRWHCLSRLIVD